MKDNYTYSYIKNCLVDYIISDNCDDIDLLHLFYAFEFIIGERYTNMEENKNYR